MSLEGTQMIFTKSLNGLTQAEFERKVVWPILNRIYSTLVYDKSQHHCEITQLG